MDAMSLHDGKWFVIAYGLPYPLNRNERLVRGMNEQVNLNKCEN